MPEFWDDSLKTLVGESPQDFATWLLGDVVVVNKLQGEFKTRTIRADLVLELQRKGKNMLLQVEFQSSIDPEIPERLLGYHVEARRAHKLPVYSCVLYLKDEGVVPESPLRWDIPGDELVLEFHFRSIKLADLSAQELRQTGLVGLLPLLMLTKDGATREVAEEVISTLEGSDKPEALAVTKILASLVFTEDDDRAWLTRRYSRMVEKLRDSWAYQEILQEGVEKGIEKGREEGIEEGIEKGREEGIEKGREEGMRDAILVLVGERFSRLSPFAEEQVKRISELAVLRNILVKISAVQTIQDAGLILIGVTGDEKKN